MRAEETVQVDTRLCADTRFLAVIRVADDDAGGPRGLRHAPAIARLLLERGHDRTLRHLADREHVPDVDLRAHFFFVRGRANE